MTDAAVYLLALSVYAASYSLAPRTISWSAADLFLLKTNTFKKWRANIFLFVKRLRNFINKKKKQLSADVIMQVGNNALIGDYFQQRINKDFTPGSCSRQIAVLRGEPSSLR